jgi:TonB family protein
MNITVPDRRAWAPKLLSFTFAVASLSGFSNQAHAQAMSDPGDPTNPASCGAPDRPASVVRSAIPETPAFAQISGAAGDVVVRVDLMPDGSLQDAAVAQSSGSAALDREALRVARESEYSPALESCRAVPGSYLFTVTFDPDL